MTNTDYKLFTTELKKISKRKEFKGLSKGIKNIEEIKDAYDYMIINLFRKYRLETEELVDEMNSIWPELMENDYQKNIDKLSKYFGIGGAGITLMSFTTFSLGFGLFPALIPVIAAGNIPLKKIVVMNKYMDEIQMFSETIANKAMNENG